MASEISLFSTTSFIEASKKFVCVKLGTYENKEHQDLIRKLLKGRLANTAFTIFSPDGKTQLTRSARSPKQVFGDQTLANMNKLAAKYHAKNLEQPAILTDFHSFKQSLNAASAEQRLLIFASGSKEQLSKTSVQLQTVFNDPVMSGRFFYDLAGDKDREWPEKIKNSSKKEGIFIIQAGTYGQTGTVITQLPIHSNAEEIKTTLIQANRKFANDETRKVYREHVTNGRKEGINFENNIAAGEDRDGNGVIDSKPRGRK